MKQFIRTMLATLLLCAISTIALNSAEIAAMMAESQGKQVDAPSTVGQLYAVHPEDFVEQKAIHSQSPYKSTEIHSYPEIQTGADPIVSTEHDVKINEWKSSTGKTGDSLRRALSFGTSYVKEVIKQALEGNPDAIAEFESPKFLERFRKNYNTAEKQDVLQALETRANESADDSTIKNNLEMIITKLTSLTLKTGQDIYHNDSTGKHHIVLYQKGKLLDYDIAEQLNPNISDKLKNNEQQDIINQRFQSLTAAQRPIFIDQLNNDQKNSGKSIERIIDTAYDEAVQTPDTSPVQFSFKKWISQLFAQEKPDVTDKEITQHVNVVSHSFGLTGSGEGSGLSQHVFERGDQKHRKALNLLGLHQWGTVDVSSQKQSETKTSPKKIIDLSEI